MIDFGGFSPAFNVFFLGAFILFAYFPFSFTSRGI
jgi:hypothetical protein